jgi:membrane-associated phospholipid phosphatase
MKGMYCLWSIAGLLLCAGLMFGLAPQIDLAVSEPFAAEGFILKTSTLAVLLRQLGQWLPLIVAFSCLFALAAPLLNPHWRSGLDARRLSAILLAFVIGPGLLVNVVLKDHWHRPRPTQIAVFGGTSEFKPWWDRSGACKTNCSFASGEVSAATASIAVIMLVPAAYMGSALALAIVLASIVAFLRLAFGGHFLSDIVFAVLITQFVTAALMTFFHSRHWRYGREDRLEQDIRLLAFRLRAQAPWLQSKPRWLVRSAHPASGQPAFSPTLGGVTIVGWESADEHAGLYAR